MDKTYVWISFLACIHASFLISVSASAGPRAEALNMQALPHFLPARKQYSYAEGHTAFLVCAVENLGKRQVVWRKAEEKSPLTLGMFKFTTDDRLSIENQGREWNLIIRNLRQDDSGLYECQISSEAKHLRNFVTLIVTEPPSKTTPTPNIQISGSTYVDEGDPLHLVCNASSRDYPPQDIDWFRDGTSLQSHEKGLMITKHVALPSGGRRGTIRSTLRIEHAQLTDAGTYVCRTSNKDVIDTRVNVLKSSRMDTKKRGTEKDGANASYRTTSNQDNGAVPMTTVMLTQILSFSLVSVLITWFISSPMDLT